MTLLMRDRENIEKGRQEGLIELVRDGLLTISECAKRTDLSEEEIKEILYSFDK